MSKLELLMISLKDYSAEHHQLVFRTGKYKTKTFEEVFELDRLYMKWFSRMEAKGVLIRDQKALIKFLANKELAKHSEEELPAYRDLSEYELIELLIPAEEEEKDKEKHVGKIMFRFGKHKGKTIQDVYDEDRGYISYLLRVNEDDVNSFNNDQANFQVTPGNWMIHKILIFLSS